jgi:hypothetical protein
MRLSGIHWEFMAVNRRSVTQTGERKIERRRKKFMKRRAKEV